MSDEKSVPEALQGNDWGPGVQVSERVVKDKYGKEGIVRDVVFPPFAYCMLCGRSIEAHNLPDGDPKGLTAAETLVHKRFTEKYGHRFKDVDEKKYLALSAQAGLTRGEKDIVVGDVPKPDPTKGTT
jgi:hypothetical protein